MTPESNRTRVNLARVLPPIDFSPQVRALSGRYGADVDLAVHSVMATRRKALEIVCRIPAGPCVLDCSEVSMASPPFIDEISKHRPDVTWDAMNEDVAAAHAIVMERRR